MIVVKADAEKNTLNVTTTGVVSLDDKRKILKKFQEEMPILQDGFILVHDISKFRLYNDDYYQIYKAIHELFDEIKPSQVIRIVGTARETLAKFAKFDLQNGIENVHFVPDEEAAENLLNSIGDS